MVLVSDPSPDEGILGLLTSTKVVATGVTADSVASGSTGTCLHVQPTSSKYLR